MYGLFSILENLFWPKPYTPYTSRENKAFRGQNPTPNPTPTLHQPDGPPAACGQKQNSCLFRGSCSLGAGGWRLFFRASHHVGHCLFISFAVHAKGLQALTETRMRHRLYAV